MKKVLENNNIVYIPKEEEENVKIEFKNNGKNNIVFIGKYAKMHKTVIRFSGSNNVVYISGYESSTKKSSEPFLRLTLDLYENSSFYIGKNATVKTKCEFRGIIAQDTNVFIGNDCMLSEGVLMRTSDAHFVYDLDSYEPLNLNKSIMIGDHIWFGADIKVLKGITIGSGSTISTNALLSGRKTFCSNTVIAGLPAKVINSNAAWLRIAVHNNIQSPSKEELDQYKYVKDKNTISLKELDKKLTKSSVRKKMKIFSNLTESKNRFAIENEDIK